PRRESPGIEFSSRGPRLRTPIGASSAGARRIATASHPRRDPPEEEPPLVRRRYRETARRHEPGGPSAEFDEPSLVSRRRRAERPGARVRARPDPPLAPLLPRRRVPRPRRLDAPEHDGDRLPRRALRAPSGGVARRA